MSDSPDKTTQSLASLVTPAGGPYGKRTIAAWIGCHPTTLQTAAAEHGIGFLHANRRLFTFADAQQLRAIIRPHGQGSYSNAERERRIKITTDMLRAGRTKAEIAHALGLAPDAFHKWASRHVPGFAVQRARKRSSPTRYQIMEAERLHAGGKSLREIAAAVKLPIVKIAEILNVEVPTPEPATMSQSASQQPGPSPHIRERLGDALAELLYRHGISANRVNRKRIGAVLRLHNAGCRLAGIADDPNVELPVDVVKEIIERFGE